MTVRTRSDGRPFWLVLGQSHSDGWRASTGGHGLGAPTLVDGYANAWLVRPGHAGPVTVHLSWTPQRTIWIALSVSAVALVLCVVILIVGRRRRRTRREAERDVDAVAPVPWSWRRPGVALRPLTTVAVVGATFLGTAFVSRPTTAVVAALVAVVAALVPRSRPLVGIAAAALLMAARTAHHPSLAWYALALFAVTVVVGTLGRDDRIPRDGKARGGDGVGSAAAPSG